MQDRIKSALDLFLEYEGRFASGITMGRLGFRSELTESGRFYLEPMRGVKSLGHATIRVGYPFVDVLKAGLGPELKFRPETGVSPDKQMEDAFWEKIKEEYLDGRRFFIHLYRPHVPRWYGVSLRVKPFFPVQFRIWPALKRGMVINPRGQEPRPYVHWSALIPEGTAEHEAIRAALDLAHIVEHSAVRPDDERIRALQNMVREKIALVRA